MGGRRRGMPTNRFSASGAPARHTSTDVSRVQARDRFSQPMR